MEPTEQFDYVIVGGGSAGCVLAGRLSENPALRVCLIEAGPPDRDPRIRIPLGVIALMGNATYDWRYQSEPHAHLGGRRVSVPRGKTLGGSGSINSMVYIRGRASDYDAWAREGCNGWGWSDVLPHFIQAENNARLADDSLHGAGGPLHVQDLPTDQPLLDDLVAAGADVGIPGNHDFNGVTQEGMGCYQTTMRNGRRWSAADAFLRPAMSRRNLTVMNETLVDRAEFVDRRAVRLRVQSAGQTREIGIEGELILAAGAIGSPAVLLRSGVGPAEQIADLGIPPVLDLSGVGQNLHDHPAVAMHYAGGNKGYALSLATLLPNMIAPLRYLIGRSGLFASNTVEGGGFARTLDTLDEPDVQFHFIPARVSHEGGMITWGRGYYSDVCLLKPRSRGSLTLRSREPEAAPRIDLNLLAEPDDHEALLRGVKLLRRMLARPSLKSGNAREVVPGPSVVTDDDLVQFMRDRLGTAYHPVGTCRMGPRTGEQTVVDTDLRVIGLDNVRVADASIMPEIVAGNTNAPTMMIAAKAAEQILRG